MTDKIMDWSALALLVGFLGILGFTVFEFDLLAVIGLTVGLAGWDLIVSQRQRNVDR